MLYYLPYVEHDVEKLYELLSYCFDIIENDETIKFDTKTLFPDWYFENDSRLEKLESKIKIFVENLDRNTQLQIIKSFKISNEIEFLFSNTVDEYNRDCHIHTALDFPLYRRFLNELFADLYSDQLSPKESTFNKKNGVNLYNHYRKLESLAIYSKGNFLVCPFCGIEPLKMIDTEGRPDYDHLLPKGDSLFVFSSVNLRNLFPIGHICNKLKDTHHLLYEDNNRLNRAIAFYPYANSVDPFNLYEFDLNCLEYPSFRFGGRWKISIISKYPDDLNISLKIDTWNRVFNIFNRYQSYIQKKNNFIINSILDKIEIGTTEESLKNKIRQKIEDDYSLSYSSIALQEGLIPLRIFFTWVLKDTVYLTQLLNIRLQQIALPDIEINDTDFEL